MWSTVPHVHMKFFKLERVSPAGCFIGVALLFSRKESEHLMCASSHTSTADDVPLEDMNHSFSFSHTHTHTESELSILN